MDDEHGTPGPDGWARLRFAVIGHLLAAPPPSGQLKAALRALTATAWTHPGTGEPVRFGFSTIERWFLTARAKDDPVGTLRRRVRRDHGTRPAVSVRVGELLTAQHRAHPGWSYQLHVDNLATLVRQDATLGTLPSYASVRRWMRERGLRQRRGAAGRPGAQATAAARAAQETRSYEVTHVHGLWHLDFHVTARKVLLPAGQWICPHLLGILDDHSRLVCHAQWFVQETAADLVHGLTQAILKRGLCRALLMDNGAAMVADEVLAGLGRLGIQAKHTRRYSPEQNAKMEVFWAQVEGRLLPMLEGQPELTLGALNDATLAWLEGEYHRKVHDELGTTPLERFLHAPSVGRDSPASDTLRSAFRTTVTRRQRHSDGTFTLDGVRFEVPSRFRHLTALTVRYARWDLSAVELCDARAGTRLCALVPLDKAAYADGRRRLREPVAPRAPTDDAPAQPAGIAPRLRELMAQYAATGLPPAWLPMPSTTSPDTDVTPETSPR